MDERQKEILLGCADGGIRTVKNTISFSAANENVAHHEPTRARHAADKAFLLELEAAKAALLEEWK